jgi:hypothetical protein
MGSREYKITAGRRDLPMENKPRALVRLAVIGGIAVLLAACSIHDVDDPLTVTSNANGKPTIWQCTLVKMATPAEYACPDGKTYTASQLRDFRLGPDAPTATTK